MVSNEISNVGKSCFLFPSMVFGFLFSFFVHTKKYHVFDVSFDLLLVVFSRLAFFLSQHYTQESIKFSQL